MDGRYRRSGRLRARDSAITFPSGHAERYDVVIACDGLHFDTYVSFWTAEIHLDLIDETVLYSEPGRSVGMRTILDNSKVMAFLTFRGGPPSVTAFSNYRRVASPWIGRVQASARRQGRLMTPETEFGIRFRATISRVAERLPAKRWLVRDSMKLSNSFALPEDVRDAGRTETPRLIHADPIVEIP